MFAAIRDSHTEIVFDEEPIAGSRNAVRSGGIHAVLLEKQDALNFDAAPAQGSANPVTSGGVYAAIAGKQDDLTQVPTVSSLRETDYLFLERDGVIYKIRASAVIIPSGGDGIETESGDALLTEEGQELLIDTGGDEPNAVTTESGEQLLTESNEAITIN